MTDGPNPSRKRPTIRGVMIALLDPVEGREHEFEKWYEEVHLPDTLEVEGFLSAIRLEFTDVTLLPGVCFDQFRYMTMYELDCEDEAGFERAAERLRQTFFGGVNVDHSRAAEVSTRSRSDAMGSAKIAFLRVLSTRPAVR